MSTARSEARDRQFYARAGQIMRAAMGPSRHGGWQCDEDPLAYWEGIFAIVDLTRPSAPPPSGEGR